MEQYIHGIVVTSEKARRDCTCKLDVFNQSKLSDKRVNVFRVSVGAVVQHGIGLAVVSNDKPYYMRRPEFFL
jgi:hypothetical protein